MNAARTRVSAWEARKMEQRQLVAELLCMIVKAAESFFDDGKSVANAERVYMLVAHDLFGQMITARGGQYCRHICNGFAEVTTIGECVKRAMEMIEEFSRAPEEASELKRKLVCELFVRGTAHIQSAYSDFMRDRQEVLYSGRKGVDQVAVPIQPAWNALVTAGDCEEELHP